VTTGLAVGEGLDGVLPDGLGEAAAEVAGETVGVADAGAEPVGEGDGFGSVGPESTEKIGRAARVRKASSASSELSIRVSPLGARGESK